MATPALALSAATLLVIACLPGTSQGDNQGQATAAALNGLARQRTVGLSTSDVTESRRLGSGTPAADTRHSGDSVAVVVNGQPYVIVVGQAFGEARKRALQKNELGRSLASNRRS